MLPNNLWRVRSATTNDSSIISHLLERSPFVHQHLDWLDTDSFLDKRPFLLAINQQNELTACIACPLSLHNIAWIRVFAVNRNHEPRQLWGQLWPLALDELRSMGCKNIAALVISPWFKSLLQQSGFNETNAVVFLEWYPNSSPNTSVFPGELRGVRQSDIDRLIDLDQETFQGIWSNSRDELLRAFQTASIMTVLEFEGELIGYQLSTASAWGAHLARLAVRPNWQGKGIGNAIVTDLMLKVRKRGYHRLTVNTQEDNLRSLALYQRLGFTLISDRYPVMERMV
jgi:ribosomal-protein-alanine N-acetyltransferase